MLKASVVFATMTGNNEEVANIICDQLSHKDINVVETEISQTDMTEFVNSDILVVCAYTYDEGQMPEEGMDFYEDLGDADLSGKVFGVAGSGDRFYGEFYNTTVDKFDDTFASAGGIRGSEKVKIDLEPYEEDVEALAQFVDNLIQTAEQVKNH